MIFAQVLAGVARHHNSSTLLARRVCKAIKRNLRALKRRDAVVDLPEKIAQQHGLARISNDGDRDAIFNIRHAQLTQFLHVDAEPAFLRRERRSQLTTRTNDCELLSDVDALLRSGIDIDNVAFNIGTLLLLLLAADDLRVDGSGRVLDKTRAVSIRPSRDRSCSVCLRQYDRRGWLRRWGRSLIAAGLRARCIS